MKALVFAAIVGLCAPLAAQELPVFLRDRGRGIPTSMFGTYIEKGQWIVYPYFEYYRDKDKEYKPAEMGFGVDEDFTGRYRASEGLLWIGYGVSDRVAVEFEAAVIRATLEKSPDDPSALPARIEESGLGDVEGQIRYRFFEETPSRPELFGYTEVVFPLQKDKLLIGTQDWELKSGVGAVQGFSWGTLTVRAALEYSESTVGAGEYAIEYLRRLSPRTRFFAGIEGTEDEVELIGELQLQIARGVTLKLNNAVGITPKATDWAPEVGVLFSWGGR